MGIKHIYFVRHGETLKNRTHVHQGPSEPLSEKGREQASLIVDTLKNLKIDTLFCSHYTRARETAEVIGEGLTMPHTIIESVKEFRRPDSLYGRRHYSFHSLWYMMQLFLHRTDGDWDNEGAENMFDIRNRILDVKKIMTETDGSAIAIVSHAIFIDMFVQMVCANRPLSFIEFVKAILMAKRLPNTGIVVFEIDDTAPKGTCNWHICTEKISTNYLHQR